MSTAPDNQPRFAQLLADLTLDAAYDWYAETADQPLDWASTKEDLRGRLAAGEDVYFNSGTGTGWATLSYDGVTGTVSVNGYVNTSGPTVFGTGTAPSAPAPTPAPTTVPEPSPGSICTSTITSTRCPCWRSCTTASTRTRAASGCAWPTCT